MAPLGSQLAAHGPFTAYEGTGLRSLSLHSAVRSFALVAADCITLIFAIVAVQALLPYVGMGIPRRLLTLRELSLALFAPSISLIAYFVVRGRYSQRVPFWSETGSVIAAGLFVLAIEAVAAMLSEQQPVDHVPQLAVLLLFTMSAPVSNRLVKHILAGMGIWTLPSLIVSRSNSATSSEISQIAPDPLDYEIVGQVDPSSLLSDPDGPWLRPLLARYHCSHLFISAEDDASATRALADAALRERIPFSLIVPLGFPCTTTSPFSKDAILLSRGESPLRALLRLLKIAFDITAAALLLIATSPLLLAIALVVRWDGGPALFAHRRLGANGQYFHCLKFRTMVMNAGEILQQVLASDAERAAEWNGTQKLRDDPRVTAVGRFLRRTSLDELPQLINVLRLEMSLVGPRPIVDGETRFYGKHMDYYSAVRPGITGLWQASGRSDTSYDRRVRLDAWYVNNWSIWHDIVILLKTIPAVLKREGAR